jgi:hypothetical protein
MREITRRMPKNLKPEDRDIFNQLSRYERFIDDPRINIVTDVKINGDGLLFRNFWPLTESFSSGTLKDIPRRRHWLFFDSNYSLKQFLANPFLIKNFFSRQTIAKKKIIWFTDDWSSGYFHWLADAVPRLYLARKYLNEATVVLPAGYQGSNFITSTLDIFQVNDVHYLDKDEVMVANQVILPDHLALSGNYNPEIMQNLRQLFRAAAKVDLADSGERIYISRSDSGKRKIANEEEIIPILERHNFKIVRSEKLTFTEQLALFSRAKYLISVHGAGLTNMLFMAAGSKILEFRFDQLGVNNCFFSLASALDIDYYYQKPIRIIKNNELAELFIDPAELEKNLKLIGL